MPRPSLAGASPAPSAPGAPGPGLALAAALGLACAGCGVRLDGGGPDGSGPDGGGKPVDAAIDAPPPPCTGGDAAMRSPTGACFVLFRAPVTYANARAGCTSRGTRLAILRTAQDDQVARTLAGATLNVFIGLTDQATEGTFVWGDGSALTYTSWYMGEPNDGSGAYPEDCAVVAGPRGGAWDDRPCEPVPNVGGGLYSYLCES